MTDPELVSTIAKELRDAEERRVPVAPLVGRYGDDLDLATAYAAQRANVDAKLAGGDRVVGHKIGLTSKAMQDQLGVDQPDFGHLLSSMAVDNGATVPVDELIAPRVELEIAFLIGRPLAGPGVTAADVLAATEAVFPSLEIIDSRIADWKIGLLDTVADAASSARFVLPSRLSDIRGRDLRLVGGVMEVNGELRSWSCGAAVLGNPARCVAWLANAIGAFGGRLEPGHIVLSGALDKAVAVTAGDVVRAEFDGLGTAAVRFV